MNIQKQFEVARDAALGDGNYVPLTELCIEHVSEIDTLVLFGSTTPLTFCIRVWFRDGIVARTRLVSTVQTVVDAGASPTAIDAAGLTPLQSAQMLGYQDVVDYLNGVIP